MTLPVICGLSTRPCCVKTLADPAPASPTAFSDELLFDPLIALAGGAVVGFTSPCFFAAGAGVGFFSSPKIGNVINAASNTRKIVRMTTPFMLHNQTSLSHPDHYFIYVALPLPTKEAQRA
jgi:hypothetical protein